MTQFSCTEQTLKILNIAEFFKTKSDFNIIKIQIYINYVALSKTYLIQLKLCLLELFMIIVNKFLIIIDQYA